MAGNTIVVSVLAETSKFKQAMDGLGSMGKAAAATVVTGLAAIGAAAAAASIYSVNLAKNYEQTTGAMKTLFGPAVTANMEKWNAGLAKSIGVSKAGAAEIQKGAAITVRTLGLSGTEAESFLQKHTTNMADVGAMFNATSAQVAEAHSAVMRGEFDSAEKYGVQITADMVKRKMATDGLSEAQARQALWSEQSAIANGQAAKEAGSLSGVIERAKAIIDNLALTLGNALIPAVTEGATAFMDFLDKVGNSAEFKAFIDWVVNTAVPAFKDFSKQVIDGVVKGLTDLGNWYNENKDIINTLAVAVGAAAAVWAIWTGAIALWTAITTAATIAAALFNAVLNANPVMLVVMAIAALVAGLVFFFTQTEVGRQAWATFTAFLSSSWKGFTEFITKAWNDTVAFFSGLPGKIKAIFSSALSWLTGAGRDTIDGLKNGVTGAWNAVSSWFGSIPGMIRGAVGNAGAILSGAGNAIMDGFLTGLRNSWKAVTDFVGGIATWIRNNKGPLSYDYKLLQPAGKAIMGGFGDSLADGFSKVQDMVSGFAPELSGAMAGTFSGDLKMAAASGSGNTFYTFDGLTITTANAEEASMMEEFLTFLRRKSRAA